MMKRSHVQVSSLSLWMFLLTVPVPLASEVVCESEAACAERTWAQTKWYYSEFKADDADAQGVIRITAVDEYTLKFNGAVIRTRFGSEDWTRMDEYTIPVEKGDNEILVAVTNQGQGNGSGLLVELETAAQRTGTKVGNRFEREGAWRWSSEDPEAVEVDWSEAPFVQAGSMDVTQIAGLTDLSVEPVAGYLGDADIGTPEGGIALSLIDGRNLALGMPSNILEANDGVLTSTWKPGANALNKHVTIDLQEARRLSGVRVITKAPSSRLSSLQLSLKGYSVQVSEDQFRWTEVAVLHGITEYEETTLRFNPAVARYIRIVVAEIDGVSAPEVAEIEVYGEAYSPTGTLVSEALDLDQPGAKNIGEITWEAEVPEGTSVALQFRTSADGNSWSPWSREYAENGTPIESPEPVRLLQYRASIESPEPARLLQYLVRLSSSEERLTPRFRGIRVEFSADDVPATSALGRVSPVAVEMGRDTTFSYSLDLRISGPPGVERLIIAVPGSATLLAPVEGLVGGSEVDLDGAGMTPRGFEIPFDPALEQNAQLVVHFSAAVYSIAHSWRAQLLAPGSDNPQNVAEDTRNGGAWTVSAPQVLDQVLLDVGPVPGIFTPNDDLLNDRTTIAFTLAKVEGAQVSVRVFTLSGTLVRDLYTGPLSAGRYDGSSQVAPGWDGKWDGTNADGDLLPPGIYLYEVLVEADEGDERRMGSVGLAY